MVKFKHFSGFPESEKINLPGRNQNKPKSLLDEFDTTNIKTEKSVCIHDIQKNLNFYINYNMAK